MMKDETTTEVKTTRNIHLTQKDVERIILEWLGDSSKWAFDFDFNNKGEVEVKMIGQKTESN
jgi:hypothetical protein